MNYSKAFTYVFEDRDWVSKILIAGLIGLIPVIGWVYLGGWMVEVIRRTRAGRSDILPRTHFSTFLSLGWKYFVVSLVLMIPVILIQVFTSFGGSYVEQSESTITMIVGASVSCFSALFGIFVSVFMCMMLFAATITLAGTDEIKPSLSYEAAFRTVKANLKLFFLVYLFTALAGLIGAIGYIFCIIGTIFTMPYAFAVEGHLTGQLALAMNEVPAPFKNAAVAPENDFVEGNAPVAAENDDNDDISADISEILDAAVSEVNEDTEIPFEESIESTEEAVVEEEKGEVSSEEDTEKEELPPAE